MNMVMMYIRMGSTIVPHSRLALVSAVKWEMVGNVSKYAGRAGGVATSTKIGMVDVIGAARSGSAERVVVESPGVIASIGFGLKGAAIGAAGGIYFAGLGAIPGGICRRCYWRFWGEI